MYISIRMCVIACGNFSNLTWRMMLSSMCLCPRRLFMKRRSWEGVLSPIEMLLRSFFNFTLSVLSSLERMASFSTSNCFSIGACSRISSTSTVILLGRVSTMCVNIICYELILLLAKMASSWWNHTLGLFVLKDGTRRVMEFWTSADNKFFSASIVLNVLSKKNDQPSSKTCAGERKKIF